MSCTDNPSIANNQKGMSSSIVCASFQSTLQQRFLWACRVPGSQGRCSWTRDVLRSPKSTGPSWRHHRAAPQSEGLAFSLPEPSGKADQAKGEKTCVGRRTGVGQWGNQPVMWCCLPGVSHKSSERVFKSESLKLEGCLAWCVSK